VNRRIERRCRKYEASGFEHVEPLLPREQRMAMVMCSQSGLTERDTSSMRAERSVSVQVKCRFM
jgi:hypothetical protein